MNAPLALTEVVCAAALCLFAIGISRGADSSSMRHGPEKNYEQAIPRAELLYQAAQVVTYQRRDPLGVQLESKW